MAARQRRSRGLVLPVRRAHGRRHHRRPSVAGCCRRSDQEARLLTERVAAMTTYTVRAKRWAHGWELHIDGEGVTQARSLAAAERQVRDYLSLLHDLDDDAA